MDNSGYICCFSSPLMPGIHKVIMTEDSPDIILGEVNEHTPYTLEFAKRVQDKSLVTKLCNLLRKNSQPLPEKFITNTQDFVPQGVAVSDTFFRVGKEDALEYLDLMEGVMWAPKTIVKARRCKDDMKKIFTDGQYIRHKIGQTHFWIGNYDEELNKVSYAGKHYTLSGFAGAHHTYLNPELTRGKSWHGDNGWKSCECKVGDEWIITGDYAKQMLDA